MMGGRSFTGVSAKITAKHNDPILGEGLHEHTWTVTAYWPSEPFRDGRLLQLGLERFLATLPDEDGVLPSDLWSSEALAKRVLVLAWPIAVRVYRPEGFEAWVKL